MVECSVIVPAYNEEKIIGKNIDRLEGYLSKAMTDFEIIVVDDGSTDRTREILKEKEKNVKRLRILNCKKNIGRGGALNKAFKEAKGKYLVYTDADLAIELDLIERIVDALKNGAEIAIGSKHLKDSKVDYSLVRRFFSQAYALLARVLLGTKVMDCQCGLKGFRKETAMQLLQLVKDKGWSWDTEIIAKAEWKGFKIVELPATVVKVEKRVSKVKVLSDTWKMGRGLWEIMKEKKKFQRRGV